MERVTIGKLRNQLSAYLRRVRAGETVLVMDRTQVVARLTPVSDKESTDDRIARLTEAGLVTPPRDPKGREKTLRLLAGGPPRTKASVLRLLLEEREEGR